MTASTRFVKSTPYTRPALAVSARRPAAAPSIVHNRQAAANLRAHSVRLAVRTLGLVAADVVGFELLRTCLGVARRIAASESVVGTLLARHLPADYLTTTHYGSALLLALWATGSYGPADRRREPRRLLTAAALATAIPLWEELWQRPGEMVSHFGLTVLLLGATLLVGRSILDRVVSYVMARRGDRVVLVGTPAALAEQAARVDSLPNGLSTVALFTIEGRTADERRDEVAALPELLAECEAETVVLCGEMDSDTFAEIVRTAVTAECRVLSATRRLDLPGVRPTVVRYHGHPFVELRSAGLRGHQLLVKRALDVVGALALLALFAPLLAVIAAAVRLSSAGPAVYGQRRLGQHGASFRCLKFRSMYQDAEARLARDPALRAEYVRNDYKLPEGRDPRITPLGRFLRRTSLDELPQLWNVLRGDMSLVGPRPIVPDEIRHYSGDEHMLLLLKPGITGSWQVAGRSSIGYPNRARMELDYVEQWSLARDVRLLLRTIPAVLLQRGAH